MYLPAHVRHLRVPLLAGLAIGLIVVFSACSSEPTQPDSAGPKEPDLRASIDKINARLDELDGKLSSMGDKVETLRLAVNAAPVQNVGVPNSPAKTRGETPVAVKPATDPEQGFVSDAAIGAYRQAMILFEAEKYSEAILAFSAFLERYADHALAGSAQYYIGESYFREKEYKLALQEYQRVLTSYDRSPAVAETLKRMADTEDELKRPEEAARNRQLLSSMFPQSPAAAAESELLSKRASQPRAVATPGAAPSAKPDAEMKATEEKAGAPADDAAPKIDEPPPPTAPIEHE